MLWQVPGEQHVVQPSPEAGTNPYLSRTQKSIYTHSTVYIGSGVPRKRGIHIYIQAEVVKLRRHGEKSRIMVVQWRV